MSGARGATRRGRVGLRDCSYGDPAAPENGVRGASRVEADRPPLGTAALRVASQALFPRDGMGSLIHQPIGLFKRGVLLSPG